ncbi:hypothetical protein [Kocuria palustris]
MAKKRPNTRAARTTETALRRTRLMKASSAVSASALVATMAVGSTIAAAPAYAAHIERPCRALPASSGVVVCVSMSKRTPPRHSMTAGPRSHAATPLDGASAEAAAHQTASAACG